MSSHKCLQLCVVKDLLRSTDLTLPAGQCYLIIFADYYYYYYYLMHCFARMKCRVWEHCTASTTARCDGRKKFANARLSVVVHWARVPAGIHDFSPMMTAVILSRCVANRMMMIHSYIHTYIRTYILYVYAEHIFLSNVCFNISVRIRYFV